MKASDLRPGMTVIIDGDLYRVAEAVHKTPGNLRAFIQAKMVRIKDGTQKESRYASGDEIEKAVMESHEMQFLYKDQHEYHFMNVENYEQIALNEVSVGNGAHYLLPNIVVQITFCEGKPVGVALPSSMEFEVTEAEPGIRTATASASFKNAKIETGHMIKVPQFVQAGDRIKINPNTDQYIERAK